jgi:hypothetical protein
MSTKNRKNKNSRDKTTTSATISYRGDVEITIQKNYKNIYSKTYHNAGRLPMFKFIANCLCGQYASVEELRPKFIRLYTYEGAEDGQEVNPNEIVWDSTKMVAVSEMSIYNGTPLPETSEIKTEATASFSFLIPFSRIYKDAEVYVIALFSQKSYQDDSDGPSAYFILTRKNESGNNVWDNLIDNIGNIKSNDYTVSVQWKLTIGNK